MMEKPIWQEYCDFGHGMRLYRCMSLTERLGDSQLEFFSHPLQEWRRVNNFDVREAMRRYTAENFKDSDDLDSQDWKAVFDEWT